MNTNLKDKFIIVVPARLGSKSIKNKNIVKINSLPMICYTFNSIRNIKLNKFVLSNDNRVIKIAKNISSIVLIKDLIVCLETLVQLYHF